MKRMSNYFLEVNRLFNPFDVGLRLVFFFGMNFGVFFLLTGNLINSFLVGFIGMIFFFHVFSYKGMQLKDYQDNLNDLMKYVTNVNFFLKTGENVYYALDQTKETVNKNIKKDIQETINILQEDGVLETERFEKYNFPSINQFHQNLKVKYNQGGDSKELFDTIQNNIMNELKKRDELYKKRKGFAMNVYVMLGMVGATSLILRLMVTNLWDIFLEYTIVSSIVLIFTYLFILLNLFFLHKKVNDISVRI